MCNFLCILRFGWWATKSKNHHSFSSGCSSWSCYTIWYWIIWQCLETIVEGYQTTQRKGKQEGIFRRLIGSYTNPYWRSGISSTSVRNSVFSWVERSETSGKTLNFSRQWKKSQIFNKDECKYLFLPFQLKKQSMSISFIHSFIRMSMSCLLHKILQRHVQCSKYTLI